MMLRSEEVRRLLKTVDQASSDKRGHNMVTVLIVLLVLFLVGGGGWGYTRWRR
jgi:flagellar basal body-associated protein FliL